MADMIKVKIFRFNPDTEKQGRLVEYSLDKAPGMRILGALKALNAGGHNIAYRYGCEEWECGSCAIRVNGKPMLACKTEVQDGMVLEPLPDRPINMDLVVDRSEEFAKQAALYKVPGKKVSDVLSYEQQNRMWDAITCMECSICLASCPALHPRGGSYTYSGPEFMVQLYRTLLDTRIDKQPLDTSCSEGIWECTTCRHCVENCPQRIPILDFIERLREQIIEQKGEKVPAAIRDLNESLFKFHNPYGRPQSKRMEWAEGLQVADMKSSENGSLLFLGCEQCFNSRDQEVARAMVAVLNKLGIRYGTLGKNEVNGGDPALTTGEKGLFEELAGINISNFQKQGVKSIVTVSPHDYNIIKNEYPKLGGRFEVSHYTQILAKAVQDEGITFRNTLNKIVTYHDPCFLGRYNNVYDDPRTVLAAIPGLKLVEMALVRENAECCGGGGGGNWLDIPAGERMADRRVRQAAETGAEILAVACPFCLAMFEDAVKTQGYEGKIAVKHIVELVNGAM